MAPKPNPMFTRSEKRRARKKVVHKIKGAARKGFAKLFGIPLSPGLGGKTSRRAAHRSPGASPAGSTVRGDVISALTNLGYNSSQAKRMIPPEQSGESFDSLFRRATRKNPAELIIFGNPAKVYGRKNAIAAKRAGNPIPLALIAGFESALGSIGASALTKTSHHKGHRGTQRKKGKKNPQAVIRSGSGYWDVTNFPYGGSFKRVSKDTPVQVIGPGVKANESKVKFENGAIGIVQTRLFKSTERNPGSIERATQLFEKFQHRPGETYESERSARIRKNYTILGPLVAIGTDADQYDKFRKSYIQSKGKAAWEVYCVDHWDKLPHLAMLSGPEVNHVKRILGDPGKYVGNCPQLASSPNGNQMYALTPDPPDASFISGFDTDATKDYVDLGEATFVVYIAKKPYDILEHVHTLGEEGGSRPRLNFNRVAKELFFTGGSYRVEAPGIVH